MRYGIFSDVHANWEALEAVVKAFEKEAIDTYLCVGDIAGYGANPNECIKKVEALAKVCVAGNHDWASVDLLDMEWFNPEAAQALHWQRRQFNEQAACFLRSLEPVYRNKDLTLVHGTLDSPQEFRYMYSSDTAAATFALMKTPASFIGHTHLPGVFVAGEDNRLHYSRQSRVTLKENARYIVNVGSVGQPRDGEPSAAYCVYDTDKASIEIKRVPYDAGCARQKIIAAGLPHFLGDRLLKGI